MRLRHLFIGFRKPQDFDLSLAAKNAFTIATQDLRSQRNEPRFLIDRLDRATCFDGIADKDGTREFDALRNVKSPASRNLHADKG